MDPVPEARLARNPLMTSTDHAFLMSMIQHADAPRWTHEIGDRVESQDLEALARFRIALTEPRTPWAPHPTPTILDWVRRMRARVPAFAARLRPGLDLETRWTEIATSSRADFFGAWHEIVPVDEDLERLIVYDTSGTTGHALKIPYHPKALAMSHALAERSLAAHGVAFDPKPGTVACLNVCAQASTFTFASTFSAWKQAGFAKINLRDAEWPQGRESARRYIADMDPAFITTDPISLAQMIAWELPVRPGAIFSTALSLSTGLRNQAQEAFGCPVIDWYSMTETGPIAHKTERGYELLSHDVYVELLDETDAPVPHGEVGEITVTGGRNPYIPLLRYRTGDHARAELQDGQLVLRDLEGRALVMFRDDEGSPVNTVDIGREMRARASIVQHRFVQHADGSCHLTVRPGPYPPPNLEAILREPLERLLGTGTPLTIVFDETLGADGAKVLPFVSHLE